MSYNTSMKSEDLKKWRKKHGYSQSQLAGALGLHPLTISYWEVGRRRIPPLLPWALRALELDKQFNKEKEALPGRARRS